jgi:hypothetical protein
MAPLAHHRDCDHVLGNCSVYPGAVVLCPHGVIQVTCEACLDHEVHLEAQLALLEEAGKVIPEAH